MDLNITYKEEELIGLLKEKNLQAVSDLYDKYAPALYTVVLQIVRDEEIANNVLEKVFADILNKIDNYDAAKERLFIWMFKIARNLSIEMIKSQNKQQLLKHTSITDKMLHKMAIVEMDNYGLKKVIKNMKDEHKILVDLCYYRGFTHDEIAKTLNIPIDTVQPELRMALLELRTLLL